MTNKNLKFKRYTIGMQVFNNKSNKSCMVSFEINTNNSDELVIRAVDAESRNTYLKGINPVTLSKDYLQQFDHFEEIKEFNALCKLSGLSFCEEE